VKTAWKIEFGLWDAPRREWRKIEPEHAHALVAAQPVRCDDCGDLIPASGPVRVFVDQDGVTHHCFCGRCVVVYAQRRMQERLMSEIVTMCPHARSKGMVTRQLLMKGYALADVRFAFEELLREGELVADRRGMVSAARRVVSLFEEEEA
jgi:hypothetical protein